MMNGKKTRSNGGLGVLDVIGINTIMLKVFLGLSQLQDGRGGLSFHRGWSMLD